jgi:hypothetical protein
VRQGDQKGHKSRGRGGEIWMVTWPPKKTHVSGVYRIKLKPQKYFLMAQFDVGVYVVSSHVYGILPWCEIKK